MALKASGFAGTAKLHDLTAGGVMCDLCGEEVDSEVADAVALDCSFAQCDPESSCYHCYCLEKFLKANKCERNRKIGFPCPRGCGKGTKFKDACRGKILKSHPVSTRSEANKKRRQAELEQLAQQSVVRDKGARKKEEEARAATKAAKGREKEERSKAKTVAIKALNVANTSITTAPPPKTTAQLQKEQLAAEAKKLKSQILARTGSASSTTSLATAAGTAAKGAAPGRTVAAGSAGGKKEMKTLDEYFAEKTSASSAALERSASAASSAAPSTSAWGKSRASSASSLEAADIAEAAAAAAAGPPPAAPAMSLGSEDAFPPPAAASTSAAAPGKPPRPPPAPAAAAVQPQGAWAHKPAVSVVAAAPSAPPPPPPRAAAAAAAAPPPPQTKPEDAKLSRTQRKNQRRAEKKAAAAAAAAVAVTEAPADAGAVSPEDSSPGSSGGVEAAPAAGQPAKTPDAAVGGDEAPDVLDRCMQALVQHRLQRQVDQLCALGFPGGAALAAVQQHGGSLEGALVSLLERATGVRDSMHGLGLGGGPPAEVDLSEELQQMMELQARYGLPAGAVELSVVEHRGDLDSLAASLAQQVSSLDSPAASQQHGAQPQQQQQQQQAPGAGVLGAGGLFGTLAPPASEGSQQSYSADSWGPPSGTYSAFGFGGFAEAALHAVHGPSLLGSGADSSSLVSAASGGLGGSIWGGGAAPASGLQAAASGYTSDAQLLSLLGVSDQAAGAAGASQPSTSGGYGLLGAFDALQPGGASQSVFAQPAAGGLEAHQQLGGGGGWPSGEGLGGVSALAHPQSALASLPLWSQGSSGLGGLSQSDNQDLLVR